MKYSPLNQSLYNRNRKNFAESLPEHSIAIFNSNDQMPNNADSLMPFRQNNDLLHLCGIDQEETILVIFPEYFHAHMRELLFIKKTSQEIAIWEGHKFTKAEATEISGIENVYWLSDFENVFNILVAESKNIFLNANEHIRANVQVESRDARFTTWCKKKYPNHIYHRSAPIMHGLRAIKGEEEIDAMRIACNITETAFRRILKFVNPGVTEYEIEAEYIHEFIRNKSRGFAYEPIIASGFNACVLHYLENKDVCKNGDLILMDVGAEYANYNADMTRSIPTNGNFTERQKSVYNAVLNVMNEAKAMLISGLIIPEYQKEVCKVMENELLSLGLLDKTDIKNQDPDNPAYRKYFMHGTSHHLGLDVHDVANIYKPLKEGMVLTVEPGIYIREENLGIRLEDNVVIRKDGVENLMANIPLAIEEIEDLMNS